MTKKEEKINESVKIGQVQRTRQYKYIGLILNEKEWEDDRNHKCY